MVIQALKINQCSLPYQQTKGKILISICAEKHLAKFNIHSWFLKTLSKLGIEGNFFNLIKSIYKKPIANSILNCAKLKAIFLRSGTKTRMSTITTFTQHHILEVLAEAVR